MQILGFDMYRLTLTLAAAAFSAWIGAAPAASPESTRAIPTENPQLTPGPPNPSAAATPAASANTAEKPAAKDGKTAESTEEPPSQRNDPKRKQFLEGKLSFWFQKYQKAYELWLPLAKEGYAEAQASLGWMYHSGLGVPQDYAKAAEWYRMAADQGIATAQSNLGLFYENGFGVKQDYTEAVKWYRMASEQNYDPASFNLALLYLDGKGVSQNKELASHLLLNVYRRGMEEAKPILEAIGVKVPERTKPTAKPKSTAGHTVAPRTPPDEAPPAGK